MTLILVLVAESSSECTTMYCVEDQTRLVSAATDDKTVRPCDDFKTFAMSRFLNQSVPEDVSSQGFQIDVIASYTKQQKNILEKPTEANDRKIFKFVKRFFNSCKETGF